MNSLQEQIQLQAHDLQVLRDLVTEMRGYVSAFSDSQSRNLLARVDAILKPRVSLTVVRSCVICQEATDEIRGVCVKCRDGLAEITVQQEDS